MKDKLEPNMYVRTKDGVMKVKNIYQDEEEAIFARIENEDGNIYFFNEIIGEPSFNPIDLIEVGDYVNGYYVSKIWKSGEITHYVDKKPIRRKEKQITIQAPSYGGIIHLHNKDIKSIVTKEQFSNMEYRLGDDK